MCLVPHLTRRTTPSEILTSEITAINKAYRDALLSAASNSTWLGPVSSAQFQSFVDDILQLLERRNRCQQMQHGKCRPGAFRFEVVHQVVRVTKMRRTA